MSINKIWSPPPSIMCLEAAVVPYTNSRSGKIRGANSVHIYKRTARFWDTAIIAILNLPTRGLAAVWSPASLTPPDMEPHPVMDAATQHEIRTRTTFNFQIVDPALRLKSASSSELWFMTRPVVGLSSALINGTSRLSEAASGLLGSLGVRDLVWSNLKWEWENN